MYTYLFFIHLYFGFYLYKCTRRTPNLFIDKIPTLSGQIFHTFHFKILTRDVDELYNFINSIPSKLEDIKLKRESKYTMCMIETIHDATYEICELALAHSDINRIKIHMNQELIE